MTQLHEQVILVTGASSGIGAALARASLQRGARVILTARRRDRLQTLAAEFPDQTLVLPADLTDPDQHAPLIEKALARWQKIHILINNAGLGAYGSFLETAPAVWRQLFELNLFVPVSLTRAVLPHMLARGSGQIVNVASIAGLMAHAPDVSAYVASKHALIGFSRALARDLDGSGVQVKAACPHLTDTAFFDASPGGQAMAGLVDELRARMDRPEEVAQGILDGLQQPGLILFPTRTPAQAYARHQARVAQRLGAEAVP